MSLKLQVILALVAVQVLFGLNYPISKKIISLVSPLQWASFRLTVSSFLLLIYCFLFRNQKRPKLSFEFLKPLILLSFLGVILNQSTFLVGLSYTTAINSSILNALIPVFTLIFVVLLGRETISRKKLFGIGLAFAGVLSLRRIEEFQMTNQTWIGDLLTLLNCFFFGLFLTFSKDFFQKYDRIWSTALLFTCGAFGMTLFTYFYSGGFVPFSFDWTPQILGMMIFSLLGASILAYALNNWALAHTNASQVALFVALQPIVAATIGVLFFDEILTARTLVSSGLILFGLFFSVG